MTALRLRTTVVFHCSVLLASGAAGCSRATAAAAERPTFRGVYEVSPDRSAFLPCGSNEQWYVSTGTAAARELRRRTGTQDLQSPGGGMLPAERAVSIRRAYAEVRGDTVAVSEGRLAPVYARELRVAQVVVVQPAQGGMCP